ncbi:MAG: hypothetical protein OEY18_04745 [Candidatus Aminicenantes bacterium]|nr:hypothetical protein [Candidatus Aminicenantes bacterium]MDH5383997.1 hypothetical protein [Candidatus Aminicenantes bacterium]MDH5742148.1 hypothetical protein [Candidatus Aminicenantes bacterium]
MRAKWIFSIFLFLMSTSLFWCETQKSPERQSLEIELSFTKSSHLYFILDIGERKIDLKAKGLLLRTWKIEKIRLWGDPVLQNPISLVKKSALFPPKREEINPEETEKDEEFELEALELSDMPSSYAIILERNISIYIRPKSKGLTSLLKNIGHTLRWYFYPSLRTVWSKAKRKSYTAFDVLMENKEDCRSFYWTLAENSQFIILPP